MVYTLKTPYRDGTTRVAFDPVDFMARLAALVPKPRVNLTRYHGVLACIEDQDTIDRVLDHLRSKEQETPTLPLLTALSSPRAPPETLPLFARSESKITMHNQQGR